LLHLVGDLFELRLFCPNYHVTTCKFLLCIFQFTVLTIFVATWSFRRPWSHSGCL